MKIVEQIYELRRNFAIIGLTGRTGSGCSTVAELLTSDLTKMKSIHRDFNSGKIDNNVRKNRIINNFIKKNWKPFTAIKASDIIYYYALLLDWDSFKQEVFYNVSGPKMDKNPNDDSDKIDPLKEKFETLGNGIKECNHYIEEGQYDKNNIGIINHFQSLIFKDIPLFREEFEETLKRNTKITISKKLQEWGNNIRQYNTINNDNEIYAKAPSCLAQKLNQIIKMVRFANKVAKQPTLIVIDALRNPYEVLYFRERYSAFYLMSVNTEDSIRKQKLFEKGYNNEEVEKIDEEEKGKKDFQSSYQLIDIDKCIELSDIFITHNGEEKEKNYHLINQLYTYISLIFHPGLVPPSSIERIMQVALTAKLNSGCLSRQVGAVVTNEYYSIQSIGWNTVAEGQTPCSLRNLYDLSMQEDENAYSTFEKSNPNFSKYINKAVKAYKTAKAEVVLNGLSLAYCFKDIHTTSEEKQKGNQVHTRSLHAEENAFLQLAKYGGMGIKGGKLFTTASCCELCAKKAYQLGITEIYYIDTYPGISKQHILECGDNRPQMKLFSGVIGRAYINLYNPFLPLKDEIEALTNVNIKKIDQATNNDIPSKKEKVEKEYGNNN